jgi:predicted PurR-regulated permease PerM
MVVAPSVSQQFRQLWEQLPSAIDRIRGQLHNYEWTSWLIQQGTPAADGRKALGQVTHVFQMTFGAVAAVVIVGFLALYMAAHPKPYVEGVVRLMPISFRPRMRELLAELYRALRLWLMTKLVTMTFTGIGIGIGVYFLKVPLALALGILAGLLEFIPTIGPLLSAVPAILLALVKSPMTALYVGLLYFGVQWIGNHITTPLLQQKTLAIPPAVGLALVALLGAIFGFPGLLLSGPLSVVVVVATKMLYVEDVPRKPDANAEPPPRSRRIDQRPRTNTTEEA